jgi:hypothetical protein
LSDDHEAKESIVDREGQSPKDAAVGLTKKQLAKMLSIQLEKVDVGKSLAAFGMDRMLATEFRTWFFQTFKIDVPFYDIIEARTNVSTLADKVAAAA